MFFIIAIVSIGDMETLSGIAEHLKIPLVVSMPGRGTATKSMLEFLGIGGAREWRVVLMVATYDKCNRLVAAMRRIMYIDIPNNGVVMTVPVKSVGGGKFVSYLSGEQQSPKYTPSQNYEYELVIVIANEGYTDMVMDAARKGGATGGTVLHGKGTGYETAQRFYQMSIAQEKEMVLIVAPAEKKASIMREILHNAGPETEAGSLVFSLPVDTAAGFGRRDEEE